MVGINTVLRNDPLLTNRSGSGKSPVRVVVDGRCCIPISSRVLGSQDGYIPTIIACIRSDSDRKKIPRLIQKKTEVIQTPECAGLVDISYLMSFLASERGSTD